LKTEKAVESKDGKGGESGMRKLHKIVKTVSKTYIIVRNKKTVKTKTAKRANVQR
jgi:hypothetical protein